MSIVVIRATIACDECGKHFRVDLDPAYKPPSSWSLADVAEDSVRGGNALVDERGQSHTIAAIFGGSTSVQNGKMLCVACTRAEDEKHPEDDV